MIDRHLESMLLRQRGNNRVLVKEILEKLSQESKDRLYRILRDQEDERADLQRKVRQPWMMR